MSMRSYIFTNRERRILNQWLTEKVRIKEVDMILYRIRIFKDLERDIQLYYRVKKAMKERGLKL